jgi:peptidyl-dipeptidase A
MGVMRKFLLGGAAALALALTGCGQSAEAPKVDVETFLSNAEAELQEYSDYANRIAWVNANFITDDTDWLSTWSGSAGTLLSVRLANEAKSYDGADLTPEQKRKLNILRSGITMPSPSAGTPEEQEKIAEELSGILTRIASTYGKGKFTIDGKELNLEQLSEILAKSRDPKELQQAWEGWHTISPSMKTDYARMVEIGNAGAKELGFENIADMWLANYDMPSKDMEATVEKLWGQVQPLYNDLHCYVRGKLNAKYGDAVQPKTGAIRADLLGNMWAQDWGNINDITAPPASNPGYDLNKVLVAKGYDPIKMVKTGEAFFTGMGLAPAARNLLGALADHAPAGSRSAVPRLGVGYRQPGRHPHQDVHAGERGRLHDRPPRTRPQLLSARLQEPEPTCSRTARMMASTKPSAISSPFRSRRNT